MEYAPNEIESKWQRVWKSKKLYRTKNSVRGKENKMILVEFPYPSGNLHMGHWYAFALPDMYARYWRMRGFNVLYPIGFDAFGLPAENAAIQHNIHPRDWTTQNIAFMTKQMESMGTMFDFSRVVSTIDPAYYRWTQWMFLRMFEHKLAYRSKTQVNWCPKDKTVLANEQVVDGHCERCGTEVVQRELEQWMLRTTAYADRLLDDIEGLDWPATTRTAQQNWIGRSEGMLIRFDDIEVFTTRADTLFGCTYVVLAPEHPLVDALTTAEHRESVRQYKENVKKKTELERTFLDKEKTGVFTGASVTNPANGERIPVWVADYVLGHYGTGAIMAVPAHDERDRAFAEKFDLPISYAPPHALNEVVTMLKEKGAGKPQTQYRLHDWVLSRQRYWGVPIPIIHCPACGYVAVPDKDLPVKLPPLDDFKPTNDGRSPLAKAEKWLHVQCPVCGGPAERETDTMDTFVDSSWYYIRYADPDNDKKFADPKKIAAWLPVPMYIGGAEHNTMHLLYSRFFAKALHDLKLVPFSEPFIGRRNHGIILGPDGQKMSKSRGNVVDPDKEVAQYGADTVRMYLAFMAPYEQGGPWDSKGINGTARFLKRVWALGTSSQFSVSGSQSDIGVERAIHRTIKKIGEDIELLHFNTCVSELMKLLNVLEDHVHSGLQLTTDNWKLFLLLLAPLAPHICEELWMNMLKHKKSIHLEAWPAYDPELLVEDTVEIPVQVNGRVRGTIAVPPDISEDDAVFAARKEENIAKYLEGATVAKIIYIKGKLLNLVVS